MTGAQARPPRSLPSGFVPVWHAVRAAADESRSQRALAHQLGISTFTLHRILISGEVPDLRRASTREKRAWAKTLARLALRLGHDPRSWLDAVGIESDDTIERILQRSVRPQAPPDEKPHPLAEWLTGRDARQPLRLGIAAHPELGRCAHSGNPTFLEKFAQHLLAHLDPDAETRTHVHAPERLGSLVGTPNSTLDLAFGVWNVVATRRRGLDLVPIPALAVGYAAYRTPYSPAVPLTWSEVETDPQVELWVTPAAPIHAVLRARSLSARVREVALDRMLDPGLTARTVLLLDGWSTRCLRRSSPERFDPDQLEVPGSDESLGRAELAIGLPACLPRLHSLVEEAVTRDLFDRGVRSLIELYADLLLPPVLDMTASEAELRGLQLRAAAHTQSEFGRELRRELVRRFESVRSSAAQHPMENRAIALRRVGLVLPPEWAGVEEHCQSCSVSLHHHRGASHDYCNFCSDERGRLRSRAEVRLGIRDWMLGWQQGSTMDEVEARVDRFMSAMPAWATQSPN
ncbi:MAG: hypothetical protein R3E12_10205 [Candidatus Eisenbacteria bacterium]